MPLVYHRPAKDDPLVKGSNTLVLSIKGVRTDGRAGEDTDRLVFIVP